MRKYANEKCDSCKFDHYENDQVNIHMIMNHKFKLCLQCDDTIKNKEILLILKLLRDRSKFKIKFSLPFLSKLQNFWQMFSVEINFHLLKENIHNLKIPRKKSAFSRFLAFKYKGRAIWPSPPSSLRVKEDFLSERSSKN